MEATIIWEEERDFGQIGADDASAKFTAYLLSTEGVHDKILVEATIKVGHYPGYEDSPFEWNDTVNMAPFLTVDYIVLAEHSKLVRKMIKQADVWFAECDTRLGPARKVAEHTA